MFFTNIILKIRFGAGANINAAPPQAPQKRCGLGSANRLEK
jgi:hypothetical protein